MRDGEREVWKAYGEAANYLFDTASTREVRHGRERLRRAEHRAESYLSSPDPSAGIDIVYAKSIALDLRATLSLDGLRYGHMDPQKVRGIRGSFAERVDRSLHLLSERRLQRRESNLAQRTLYTLAGISDFYSGDSPEFALERARDICIAPDTWKERSVEVSEGSLRGERLDLDGYATVQQSYHNAVRDVSDAILRELEATMQDRKSDGVAKEDAVRDSYQRVLDLSHRMIAEEEASKVPDAFWKGENPYDEEEAERIRETERMLSFRTVRTGSVLPAKSDSYGTVLKGGLFLEEVSGRLSELEKAVFDEVISP